MDVQQVRTMARVGGVLYLMIIVIGALGEAVVRGSVVVLRNAAATAENLRSMESLWRIGIVGEITLLACGAALAAILFAILRHVSPVLAWTAVFLNLVTLSIEGVASVFLAAALFPISESAYLSSFTAPQLEALTMLAVRSHTAGFGMALVFFGIEAMILGYLIYRSGFIPRMIGLLLAIGGACYVINSVTLLLSPSLSTVIFPTIMLPALVAELSFALYLVVRGIDATAWPGAGRPEPDQKMG